MFLSLAYQMKVLRKPSLLIVCEDKDDSHGACRDEKEEEENKVHRERFSRSLKERRRRKGGEDKQDVVSSLQFSRKRQRREGNDDEEKKNRVEESPEKKQNDERGEKKKDTSEGVYTPEKKRSCSESSPVSLHNKEHHHNPMSSSSFSSSSSSFSSSSSSSSSFSFSSSSSCRGRHWMRIFRRWAPSLFVRWFLDDCVCLLPNSSSSSSSLTRSFSSSPPSEVFQRKTHFLSSPPFPDQERDQDSSTQKGTKDDDDDKKKKKSDSRSSREREEEAEEREKEAGVEEEKKSEKCLNGGSEREERGKQEETVSTVGKEEEKQKKKKRNDVGMNRRTADILLITYKDFVKYADAIERSIYTSNGLSFAIFDTRHPYSTSSASCSCSASPSSSSSSSSIHEADTFLCHEESLLYGIAETIDSFVFQIPHGERGRRRRKGEKEQEEEERATAKTDERRDLSCDLPQKLLITNCDPSLCFNTLRRLLPLLLPSIFPSLKHVDLHLSKLTSSPSISSSSASLFSPPLALSSSSSHSSSSSMAVQENNDGHDNVREDERTASVIVKEEEEKKKRERERRRGGGAFLSFLRSYVYPLILRRTRERCLYSLLPDIEGEVQLLSLQNGQSEKSLRLSPSSSSSLFLSQTERLYLQLHAVGKQKLYECIMKINTAGENDEKKRRKKEEEEEKKKKKKVQQEECRRDERDEEEEKGKKKEDRVDEEEEEEERLRSLCVQEHARDMIRNLLLFTIHPMLVSKDLISSSLSLMRQDEKGKKEKNKEDGRLGCLEKEREEEEEEDLLIKRVSTALSEILRVSSFSFPSSSSFRHLPSRTSSSHASQGCSLPCLHTRKSSLQQQKSTLLCLSRSPGACTDSNDRNATAHLMNSMEKERREEEEEEERRRGIEEEEEECKIVCSYCLASSDGKRRIERILKTHFNTWQIRRLAGLLGVSPWYLSKEEINQSAKIKWLVDFLRESSSKTRLEKSSSSSNSSSSFSKFMSSRHPYLQQGRVQEPTFPEDSHQQNSAEDISTTTKRDEEEEEEEEKKKKNEKKEKRKTVSMKDDEGPVVVEEEEKENCMDKTHTSGFDKNTIGAARSTSSRCANVDSLHKKKNHRSTVERGMEERVRGKEGERRGEGEEEEDRKEEREKFSGWSGHGRKVVILNPLCEGGRMDRRDRRRGRREVEDKRRRKDRNREQEEDEEKGDEELYERLRMGGRENEGSVASFLQAALGKLIFAISPGVSTAEAGQILHHFLKEDSANVPALLIEDLSSLFYLRPHALSHITDLIWLSFPPTARSIVFPSSSSFCSPFELSSSFSGEFVLLQPALVSHQQQPMQKKAKVERPLATSLDTSTGRILSRREDEDLQGEERSSNAEADSCRRSPVNRSLLNVAADHPRHSTRIQSNREGDRKAQEGLVVRGVGEEEDLLKNGEEEKKEEERGRCCLKVGRIEEERKEETLVTGKDKMEVQENERKIFHEEEDEEEFLAIREDMRRVESYFKCVGGHALLGDQKKLSVYYLCCEKTMDEVCLRPISQLQANHVS